MTVGTGDSCSDLSHLASVRLEDLGAFDLLSTPIWIFDFKNLRHIWANGQGLKFWQAETVEELCSRDLSDISEGARRRLQACEARLLAGEEQIAEQWTLYPLGEARGVKLVCRGLLVEGYGFVMSFEAEPGLLDTLEIQTRRSQEALRHTNMVVALFNQSGKPEYHNPAFEEAFGHGCRFAELFERVEDRRSFEAQLKAEGQTFMEAPLLTYGGAIWFAVQGRALLDPGTGKDAFYLTALDITERRTADHRAQEALAEMEQANRAKSDFLARMSHELRSPLNAILGFSTVIRDGTFGPCSPPRYVDYATDIHRAAELLLDLINDLLEYTSIGLGGPGLDEETLVVSDLVEDVAAVVRPRAGAAELLLSIHLEGDLPLLIGDPLKVKQILLNLLVNAVKFTPTGGRIQLEVGRSTEGGLRFRVEDTGVGIHADHLPKITDPFDQGKRHALEPAEGTGLGLAVVKALAQAHNARFEIASEEGRGTTAAVTFPPERLKDA
ncbi:MAG: ATP-binding protein [Magnetovibrionaceae bacterium]